MKLYISKPGDSVRSAACRLGLSAQELLFYNALSDPERLIPNLALIAPGKSAEERIHCETFAAAHPGLSAAQLSRLMPALSFFSALRLNTDSVFSGAGSVPKIDHAAFGSAIPLLTLTNLDCTGQYSAMSAHRLLYSEESRRKLYGELLSALTETGCMGLYLELLRLFPFDIEPYDTAVDYLASLLHERGCFLLAALPEKEEFKDTALYSAHCRTLQRRADRAVLTGGIDIFSPPAPVFSLSETRLAARDASACISPGKLLLGFPDCSLDWTLPWHQGDSAEPMSSERVLSSAVSAGSAIKYHPVSGSCSYEYIDPAGLMHCVHFQDGRGFLSLISLVRSLGCAGAFMGSAGPGTLGRLMCVESGLAVRKFI